MSSSDQPADYPGPVAPAGLGYVPEGYTPPPPPPSRRSRWLWALAGLVAVGVLAVSIVFLYRWATTWDGRPIRGDAELTVRVLASPDLASPDKATVDAAGQAVLARLTAAGLTRPTVTVVDERTLRVTAGPGEAERARLQLTRGQFSLRKVLGKVETRPAGASPAGCPADGTGPATTLDAVRSQLGEAYDRAAALTDPPVTDAGAFPEFAALNCAEVAVLPPLVQYVVPSITCAVLDGRLPDLIGPNPTAQVTACDDQNTKYLLDRATVSDGEIAKVWAEQGTPPDTDWRVMLRFTDAAQQRWTALTRGAETASVALQAAVLVDNAVLSAPEITSEIPGDTQLSGGVGEWRDDHDVRGFVALLASDPLRVNLRVTSVQKVR